MWSSSHWIVMSPGNGGNPIIATAGTSASEATNTIRNRIMSLLTGAPLSVPQDFDHSAGQPVEVRVADCEGGRQIYNVAEGAHPDAFFHESALQRIEVGDSLQFHHADGAPHAHVLYARQAEAGAKPAREFLADFGGLQKARLAFEQIERGVGRGAGQRIAHIGRPMHERVCGIVGPEG